MAAAHQAWSEELRFSVAGLTRAVTILAPFSSPSLPRLKSLEAALKNTQRICDQAVGLATVISYRGLESELALLVTGFAALLEVLASPLRHLGCQLTSDSACSIGRVDECVFWLLWRVLATGCAVFHTMAQTCPDLPVQKNHFLFSPLQPLFQDLLT